MISSLRKPSTISTEKRATQMAVKPRLVASKTNTGCSCGGGCPQCQSKISSAPIEKFTVSQPGEPLEQDAEQTASKIVSMAERNFKIKSNESPKPDLHTRSVRPLSTTKFAVPPIVHDVLQSPGSPMDAKSRGFMEQRFGREFSAVRIHNNRAAADAASAMSARAFTVDNNIVFNSGRYSPSTTTGKRLLAHELTHVAQRADNPRLGNSLIQRDGEPGTSVYTEHVESSTSNSSNPGVWRGSVRRTESTEAGRVFSTGRVPVHYNENNCTVTIPMTVSFRHANLSDVNRCPPSWNNPPPSSLPDPVSESRLQTIGEQYIASINEKLNGWYKVRLENCETNPCYDRDMPINVEVSKSSEGEEPDYEIAVVNMSGRSCVSDREYVRSGSGGTVILYAQGLSRSTMAHEGVHMVLGHGDEYRERQRPGENRPEDRVREDDYSLAGSHSRFGRFAMLHERHFAFVPAYLNFLKPQCNARLVENDRPMLNDIGVHFGLGYAGFPTGDGNVNSGLFLQIGQRFGIPLTKLRELELVMGPNFTMLADFNDPRLALLLGFRLGLEYANTPSSGGLTAGAYGEVGAGWLDSGTSTGFQTSTYFEAGSTLGYTFRRTPRPSIQLDAAYGRISETVGFVGEPARSPEQLRYFRLGLTLSARF